MNRGGKPGIELTKDQESAYLDAVKQGASNREAASRAGIGYWVTRRLLSDDQSFIRKVEKAKAAHQRDKDRIAASKSLRIARRQKDLDKAMEGLLTFAETGRRLHRSKEYIRVMVNRGILPTVNSVFGRLVVIDEVPMDRFPDQDQEVAS